MCVCVDQIFTVKQVNEKGQVKECRVYMCFMDLEKTYDMVKKEALWQVF